MKQLCQVDDKIIIRLKVKVLQCQDLSHHLISVATKSDSQHDHEIEILGETTEDGGGVGGGEDLGHLGEEVHQVLQQSLHKPGPLLSLHQGSS